MNCSSYNECSDSVLVGRAKAGDGKALTLLIEKYIESVKFKALSFKRLCMDDREDLHQVGMISFLTAIYSYDESRGASFNTYMSCVVVKRMMREYRDMCKYSSRYIVSDPESDEMFIKFESTELSPEEIYFSEFDFVEFLDFLESDLSAFEKEVYNFYMMNLSYEEIGNTLKCTAKSVDNALQRIKNKIRKFLQNRNK